MKPTAPLILSVILATCAHAAEPPLDDFLYKDPTTPPSLETHGRNRLAPARPGCGA